MLPKSKIDYFGIVLGILVFIAVGTRYLDYVWAKNTLVSTYAPCDPTEESCFIATEDTAWTEIQLEPYKKITIREKYAPSCLEEHTCEGFSCGDLTDCSEETCSEDVLEEGESCVEETTPTTQEEETTEATSTEELQTI